MLTMLRNENRARTRVKAALKIPVDSGSRITVRRTIPVVYVNVATTLFNPNGIALLTMCFASRAFTPRVNQANFRREVTADRMSITKLPARKASETSTRPSPRNITTSAALTVTDRSAIVIKAAYSNFSNARNTDENVVAYVVTTLDTPRISVTVLAVGSLRTSCVPTHRARIAIAASRRRSRLTRVRYRLARDRSAATWIDMTSSSPSETSRRNQPGNANPN